MEESLRKLRLDHLVLVHQCLSDYYGAWHALEDLYDEGKVRAIGVSNFSAERMADIATFNRVAPAVNQVETHLFFQQHSLHGWMEKYGVQHEAWGPLAQHLFVFNKKLMIGAGAVLLDSSLIPSPPIMPQGRACGVGPAREIVHRGFGYEQAPGLRV